MKTTTLRRKQKNESYQVIVDDEDFHLLEEHTYHIQKGHSGHPYVRRWIRIDKGYSYIPLHREIYIRHFGEIPKDKIVDHINGNTLDCRKENLRLATRQQNRINSKGIASSSKYKGVQKYQNGTYSVVIKHNDIRIFSHGYKSEIEAAKVADKIYFGLSGEFARLNFPELKEAI